MIVQRAGHKGERKGLKLLRGKLSGGFYEETMTIIRNIGGCGGGIERTHKLSSGLRGTNASLLKENLIGYNFYDT